jgi:hypothetical protein
MKEKIIEILYKAIDNAFAFEVYDGPKSEQDLTKNNEFFADEILQLTQPTEKPSAEEWLDQEFGDAYIEHDGFGDTKFLSKGTVIEALNQYAKQ